MIRLFDKKYASFYLFIESYSTLFHLVQDQRLPEF